nr:MAG TPA: Thrombin inhibitor from mosquito [Caudoviricetes sp.]
MHLLRWLYETLGETITIAFLCIALAALYLLSK